MPTRNPHGRKLAPPPRALGQMALLGSATTAMQQAGLPDEDIDRMQRAVLRKRTILGAVRALSQWLDLGMPEKDY